MTVTIVVRVIGVIAILCFSLLLPLTVLAQPKHYEGKKTIVVAPKNNGVIPPKLKAFGGKTHAEAQDQNAGVAVVDDQEIDVKQVNGNRKSHAQAPSGGNQGDAWNEVSEEWQGNGNLNVVLSIKGDAKAPNPHYALASSNAFATVEGDIIHVYDSNGQDIRDALIQNGLLVNNTVNLKGQEKQGTIPNNPNKLPTGVKDPLVFRMFDGDGNEVFSQTLFDDEMKLGGGATALWDAGGITITGGDGAGVVYTFYRQEGAAVETGGFSLINGAFSTSGFFTGLPWSVSSSNGIQTVSLDGSYLGGLQSFDLDAVAATYAGPLPALKYWTADDSLYGLAYDSAVPEPGAVAFAVISGVGVMGLILRRKRKP